MLCVQGCPAGTLDSAHLEPEMTPSQDHPNICRFYQEILKELKKKHKSYTVDFVLVELIPVPVAIQPSCLHLSVLNGTRHSSC